MDFPELGTDVELTSLLFSEIFVVVGVEEIKSFCSCEWEKRIFLLKLTSQWNLLDHHTGIKSGNKQLNRYPENEETPSLSLYFNP